MSLTGCVSIIRLIFLILLILPHAQVHLTDVLFKYFLGPLYRGSIASNLLSMYYLSNRKSPPPFDAELYCLMTELHGCQKSAPFDLQAE